jgi:protein-S-isoprenylcysteine O-methyltransferase Ste14
MTLGLSLMFWGISTFLIARTAIYPASRARAFVHTGPYRFSRNPMYLGLFLIYVGVALVNSKLWPLATMILPFLLLQRVVIPLEEQQMTKRFGQAYLDYCARVPRWF